MESFNQIGKLNISRDSSNVDSSPEYNLYENEEDNYYYNNIKKSNDMDIEKETKHRFQIPYVIVIAIFVFLITIATIIAYLIVISTYKPNYIYEENVYLKPKISGHNYSSLTFDNGMKIILTQVHFNDTAGGAISFDKGYLNNNYKQGYLNLAVLSLIDKIKNGKTEKAYKQLRNYLGKLDYSVDQEYSTFYFTILNNGFKKYLKYFGELSYLKEQDERLNNDYIKSILEKFPNFTTNNNKREDHLLEYLIYGYKDNKGNDSLPQGDKKDFNLTDFDDFNSISDIMQSLFYNPSKIKVILFSHYKMSMMRKMVLRYFKIVFNDENLNEINDGYNISNFETNKIIYYELKKDEINYMKINYYINSINNTIDQLALDSGYFNYIKDILQETKEGSLYYELAESNQDMSIKSISCDIDVILKTKILFSIKIELNVYSFVNLKEIITNVYNYMEKIKDLIENLKQEDERIKELYYLNFQNFTFTEDNHAGVYYKQKAQDLFYLDYYYYFLKYVWIPFNFTQNLNLIKKYSAQLTMENSVVIIGIDRFIRRKYSLNKTNLSFLFDEKNLKNTKYFTLKYSIYNLSILNIELNTKNNYQDIRFFKNVFKSNFTNETKLIHYEEDDTDYFNKKTELICSENNETYNFFYFRDTSFGIPKVYISLYILHPFLRPNLTISEGDDDPNDKLFLQIILFISYLENEINYRLADAKRAGNQFTVGFSENFIYIDIYAYSDIVHKILTIINYIITDSINIINSKSDVYKDYAFTILNSKSIQTDDKIKLGFEDYIFDDLPIYNFYKFPIRKFINEKVQMDQNFNSFIIEGYIFGYYSKDESLKICDIFNKSSNSFYSTLEAANLFNKRNNSYIITKDNFVKKLVSRIDINEIYIDTNFSSDLNNSNSRNNIKNKKNQTYFYKKFSHYSYKNSILSKTIENILKDNRDNIIVTGWNQMNSYLKVVFNKKIDDENININDIIIQELDKSGITEEVDVIGTRFYYIMKNIQQSKIDKHDDLKEGAITKSVENLYDREFDPDKNIYFDMKFDEFKDTITKMNNEFPNYIEFK